MFISNPFNVGSISAGALLGTTGTSELIASINESLMGSNFVSNIKDTFHEIRNSFFENVIKPIQKGKNEVIQLANVLMNPDVIRPLIDIIDFKAIPPVMYEPIIMFPPVRTLLEQGRINGFGFDPDFLPQEDVWGRLINNGVCEDVLSNVDENGEVWLSWEFQSTDPDHTLEELDAIDLTRQAILRILETTDLDPTDISEERG